MANEDSNTVTVLLGNGDGTFTAAPTSPATGINPISIAVGDFNGDGISDLAVANAGSEKATVLLAGRTAATATASGIALPVATGTHLVLASYSGDSNYGAGTSATTSLTATQGTPTVSVTASANPVAYGIAVTLKATVTGSGLTPTGTVTFYVGTTPLAKGTLSGGVYPYPTNTFAPGSYSITASYAGDSNYVAATSAALGLTVTQGTPTIVWPAPAPITYGTNLSAILDAAAQNGSGTNVLALLLILRRQPAERPSRNSGNDPWNRQLYTRRELYASIFQPLHVGYGFRPTDREPGSADHYLPESGYSDLWRSSDHVKGNGIFGASG